MKRVTAHVIAIGDEILYGQTLDTNSNHIALYLSEINVDLLKISDIKDDEATIKKEISESEADIIITTGGLGPTRDDKTKYVIADLLETSLEIDETALVWVKNYYEKVTKRKINQINQNQALVPVGSLALENKVGTASALWTEWKGKTIINLPGIPNEMRFLMKNQIIPRIKKNFQREYVIHQFVHCINMPESVMAEKLYDFENQLPEHISLAYLPRNKRVKLRLTARGKDLETLKEKLSLLANQIEEILPDNIYSKGDKSLMSIIAEKLIKNRLTIATAESFTSGRISKELSSLSGSSEYFVGGVTTYSTQQKINLLKVPETLINQYGVANKEVAEAMAKGALKLFNSDISVATTGVAGPNKDDFGTEVGNAYVAIATKQKVESHHIFYENLERKEFSDKISDIAIDQLYKFLKAF